MAESPTSFTPTQPIRRFFAYEKARPLELKLYKNKVSIESLQRNGIEFQSTPIIIIFFHTVTQPTAEFTYEIKF